MSVCAANAECTYTGPTGPVLAAPIAECFINEKRAFGKIESGIRFLKMNGRRHFGVANHVSSVNEASHTEFKYKRGVTENSTPLATIWKDKTGVCQDFAHVGLSILRTAGLPARYVCGYIETDPVRAPDGTVRRMTGAVATHAWIEVLVPGMTWVAIDPTNRQWINERYVAVSFGRDQRDASPLRGTFKGSGGQGMKVRVVMKRRAAKPEKTRVTT